MSASMSARSLPRSRVSALAGQSATAPLRRLRAVAAPAAPAPAAAAPHHAAGWRPRTAACAAASAARELWLETTSKACLTAAVEAGHGTLLFGPDAAAQARAERWAALARFTALRVGGDGQITGPGGERVGAVARVAGCGDLAAAERLAGGGGCVVLDCADAAGWKVIPAENLVAAFQGSGAKLIGAAASAEDARVMLTALEVGTSGVLLRTDDPAEVRAVADFLRQRAAEGAPALSLAPATVTRVSPAGMADRVCVDLASNLAPGEGMLVGSFSRALFLVHSECMESEYIQSRPFRVNAGAVHAYIQAPGGRTAYLSELRSGSEVLVADAAGRARPAVVGRCKVEARPMLLVEARTEGGGVVSTLLQNAETVRLVGPAAAARGGGSAEGGGGGDSSGSSGGAGWRAISVSQLAPGDKVLLLEQQGARHTGISIQERINEM